MKHQQNEKLDVGTAEINLPIGRTKLYFPFSEKEIDVQIGEIFKEDVYNPKTNKKDLVVVDIGANIGMASLYFQSRAKQIYSLEPNRHVYACLVKNVGKYKNIKTFNKAVSYTTGRSTMYAEKLEDTPQSLYSEKYLNTMPIETITLGDFIQENKIKHIDVLKVDVEGWEYPIFSSKSFLDNAHMIDTIVGESHYLGGFRPQIIPAMLKRAGFKTKFHKFKNLAFAAVVGTPPEQYVYKVTEATNFIAKR